jgi:hypothetical protein
VKGGEKTMKKEWKKPDLEVLDFRMTMSNGVGHNNGNNNGNNGNGNAPGHIKYDDSNNITGNGNGYGHRKGEFGS